MARNKYGQIIGEALGKGLSNMANSWQASGTYRDWQDQYGGGAEGSAIDENAMAELVARMGSNPYGQQYLSSANLQFEGGQRQQQEQMAADLKTQQDEQFAQQQLAAQNQAIMQLMAQQGMLPDPEAIPQVARASMGLEDLQMNRSVPAPYPGQPPQIPMAGAMPQGGPEMPNLQMISQVPVFNAPEPVPEKMNVNETLYNMPGGGLMQYGYTPSGQRVPMPLEQGVTPYQKPAKTGGRGGGKDKELTWNQGMDIAEAHAGRKKAGKTSKRLHTQYQKINKLPRQSEINEAINEATYGDAEGVSSDEKMNALNRKYGRVLGYDKEGNISLVKGAKVYEDELEGWKVRKDQNADEYNGYNETLKRAAASGRTDAQETAAYKF